MVAPAIVRMVPNDEENLTGSCLDFSIVIFLNSVKRCLEKTESVNYSY